MPQNRRNHRRKTGECRPHATIPQTRIINSTLGRRAAFALARKCIIEQAGRSCDAQEESAQKRVWKPRKRRRDVFSAELRGKCLSRSRDDLFLKPRSPSSRGGEKRKKKKQNSVTALHASRGLLLLPLLEPKAAICRYTKTRSQ